MQHARAPGSVIFTEDEMDRIQLAQVALLVGKFQSEVRREPPRDMADLWAINNANKRIEHERRMRQRGQ